MRVILFISTMFLMCRACPAQTCKEQFISDFIRTLEKKQKKYIRVLEKKIKEECGDHWEKPDSVQYTTIPQLYFSRSVKNKKVIDSTLLLCYLDATKIYFGDVFVHTDSTLVDTADIVKYRLKNPLKYSKSDMNAFDTLKKLKPDYAFLISSPLRYFFIKNNEIYVLDIFQDKLYILNDYIRDRMLISTDLMLNDQKSIIYPQYEPETFIYPKIMKDKPL